MLNSVVRTPKKIEQPLCLFMWPEFFYPMSKQIT
jgi:hypothetical protein